MAADNSKANPAQEAYDKNQAQWAVYRARKVAEREARHDIRPDEKSCAGWPRS